MYQNILNFLLGKNKKTLSKEEADDLIRLLAQSMGLEEEYKERTDEKSIIKRILDEVDTEEEEFGEALDVIFDFEEESEEDFNEEEFNVDERPLGKRRFKRGDVFKKVVGDNSMGDVDKVDNSRDVDKEDNSKDKSKDVDSNLTFNLPPSIPSFNLPSTPFNLPPSIPSSNQSSTPFNLPSTPKIEDIDFPFEIGSLQPVDNTGPVYKFYDEENKEL